MERHVEVEPGSRFIAAWELGRRIGALLHPTPDTPPLLVTLQKKIAEAEPNHYRIEELSDADVQYLRATWKGIDIPDALNMTREQWALCKAAFQSAPNRPAWELAAGFKNYAQEARSEQFRIANKHVQAMNALIRAGQMRAYDADLAPVQKIEGWGSQIPVDDARAYLAGLGIGLREQAQAGRRSVADTIAMMNLSIEQQAAEAMAEGYRPAEGPYRRTLPNGKRFFTVDEAAMETAQALHPKQRDDAAGAKVKGFYLHEVARPSQAANLTDEQMREIDDVWRAAGFPDPAFPMERYTFDAYALALSGSEIGKTWALGANLTSRETHAAILRAATMAAHVELLRKAIAAGTVTALHPATKTPIGADAAGVAALIRRADLVAFAATLPEPIELVTPGDAPEPAPQPAPGVQAATGAAPTLAEQWKAADAAGKTNLGIEALRLRKTQTAAAKVFGISRQRFAEVLPEEHRKGKRKNSATLASSFPKSPWNPHKS